MKNIRRLLSYVIAALLLTGCSTQGSNYSEPERCALCSEEMNYGIWASGDQLCAKCFVDKGYMLCKLCRNAYMPGWDEEGADGYCGGCSKTRTWYCSVCESRLDIEQLADFGNGYYLCGRCLFNSIEVPDGMADALAESSLYISRYEYLENRNN